MSETVPTYPEINEEDAKKEFSDAFPEPDWSSLTAGIVNQDADKMRKARFYGENKLQREITEQKGIKKILAQVWKGGIAKSYYRQKYINEAKRDIDSANSLLLDYDENERRRYNREVCEAFIDSVEGVIDEEKGDKRSSLKNDYPEIYNDISDVVKKYADGSIENNEEANRQFDDLMNKLQRETEGNGTHFATTNLMHVAVEAKNRYNSLMTIADSVGSKLEHDDAMAKVMAGFDVLYGSRQMDRIDPHYNRVDKLVDKLQSSKLGCVVSPEKIALAAGAAMSVSEMVGKKTIRSVFKVVPGASAAILGGMQAGATFERERAQASVDLRYNRTFDANQKRRKEVMETTYKHYDAKEVTEDLYSRVHEIKELMSRGENIEDKKNTLIDSLTKCSFCLSQDKTDKPILSYSSELKAPMEQIKLLQSFVRAKNFLKESGIDDIEDQISKRSEILEELNNDIEKTDKTAKKLKVERILKKTASSFVSGAAIGMITQEISALFNPNVTGLLEDGSKDNYGARLTSGKKIASLFAPKTEAGIISTNLDITSGKLESNSDRANFVQNSDGTYSVEVDGKKVADNIDWDSTTGKMTEESIKKLQEQGINVTEGNAIKQEFYNTIERTETKDVSIEEYIDQSRDDVKTVSRSFWYNNNTEVFDKNELACHYFTDESGNHGLVTSMTDTGSYSGDKIATFSKLAKEGSIKLLISATNDTQQTPIVIDGTLLENGQLSFVPEPGSAASAFFDDKGKFIGRFAEVVHVLDEDQSGTLSVAPLATAVGKGFSGPVPITQTITEVIKKTIDIPQYNLEMPEVQFNLPIIFPMSLEKSMNASEKHTNSNIILEPESSNKNGYGSVEIIDNSIGEISPRITEGKKLELGEETNWYREQLVKHAGSSYEQEIEKNIQKSPELMALNNQTKTIVTIPVHAPTEKENIYKTLSFYAKQKDVDFDSFTILLDLNWREKENGDAETVKRNIQTTKDAIERAKQDFPNLKIATYDQPGHKGIGTVARSLNDTALLAINDAINDGRMDKDNEVLIIRNDADLQHMNQNYLSAYQEAMRKNPKTPMFTGTTWFNIERTKKAPGFGAVMTIERMNNLLGAVNGVIHTAGANFAYRASSFAAVNGFSYESAGAKDNWEGAGSDDLRVGYRLETAYMQANRAKKDNTFAQNDNLMNPDTQLLVRAGKATIATDDQRYLKYYASDNDYATDDTYNTFDLRPNDAKDDYAELIQDRQQFNHTVEQFEREMSSWYARGGLMDYNLNRALRWWFGGSLDGLFVLHPNSNGSISRVAEDGRPSFRFTEEGKRKFYASLLGRMGNGLSTDDRNSMQRAVSSGLWI